MLSLTCVFELMDMHLSERKFETCKKLACMQTMGGGDSEGHQAASLVTSTYHVEPYVDT